MHPYLILVILFAIVPIAFFIWSYGYHLKAQKAGKTDIYPWFAPVLVTGIFWGLSIYIWLWNNGYVA